MNNRIISPLSQSQVAFVFLWFFQNPFIYCRPRFECNYVVKIPLVRFMASVGLIALCEGSVGVGAESLRRFAGCDPFCDLEADLCTMCKVTVGPADLLSLFRQEDIFGFEREDN